MIYKFTERPFNLSERILVTMISRVAMAMQFLESKRVVHRDLAARLGFNA